jgi:NhaP-type Na+/H+ or K+/H+ antiporter
MTYETAAFLGGIGLGLALMIGGALLLRFLAIRDMRARDARRASSLSAGRPSAS